MELKGYSGCELSLYERNGVKLVRKTAKNFDYNERLEKQAVKQNNYNGVFYTPKIIEQEYVESLFTFSMEYINGCSFCDHMLTMTHTDMEHFIALCFNNITNRAQHHLDLSSLFEKKIVALREIIGYNCAFLNNIMELLFEHDWSNIEQGYCHGDFTLENIIVYKSRFYLIDFLDSFCNSWLIDIAKLLQDVELYWAYRNKSSLLVASKDSLNFMKNLIYESVALQAGEACIKDLHYILLLNTLRIVPYIKDKTSKFCVENGLSHVYNIIIKKYL